tara:strand:- start:270 stop:638 length:369 start_codon:yes stop_codon:yes gene_type:complete
MSNLIKGKFQSFVDPRNGTKKINALIKLKTLIEAANEDGEVAITIIPQKEENMENKKHIQMYGDHYAIQNTHYDIAKGKAIRKAKELAQSVIMNPEIKELEAEATFTDEELDMLYDNKLNNY